MAAPDGIVVDDSAVVCALQPAEAKAGTVLRRDIAQVFPAPAFR
jgi:hypothetical protein